MASSPNKFSLFLLLLTILLSSLHVHARDSQFFSKVTNPNTNIPKQELPLTNNEQKQEEQPNFIPQGQDSGYGLYGHESEQTTTTSGSVPYANTNKNEPQGMSDTRFMEKGYTTPINGANMYNQENNYYNGEKQGMSDTRFMEKGYTSAPVEGYEYVNGVNVYGQDKDTSDTRFMEKGYTTPINSNGGYMYNPEKQGVSDTRFTEKAYTTPINGGNMYNQEKQGMSDTRFLENGMYYYNPNTENYKTLNANDNSRRFDSKYQYNNRGNYGNSYEFNNNANSMEFQEGDLP